jgi:hypothetical protein
MEEFAGDLQLFLLLNNKKKRPDVRAFFCHLSLSHKILECSGIKEDGG